MAEDESVSLPQEDQPNPKRQKMSTTATSDDEEDQENAPVLPIKARFKRRKIAIFFSYCGFGYQGMQKNPGAKTIEGDLEEALYLSGAIPEAERGQTKRFDWARAARTDKGVSAVGQVVSGKFYIDPPGLIERLNSNLSPQIRVFGYKRTTASFNAKKFCDRRRYVYLIPVFALDPSCHRDRESVLASVWSGNEPAKCLECSERGRNFLGVIGNCSAESKTLSGSAKSSSGIVLNGCFVSEEKIDEVSSFENKEIANSISEKNPDSESKKTGACREGGIWDNQTAEANPAIPSSNVTDIGKHVIVINSSEKENDPANASNNIIVGEQGKKSDFCYGEAEKERFNRILKYYEGTHNFHNFTTRVKAEDPAAKRYIISFNANTVVNVDGIDFVKCEVVGQSFMLHQIRKMIGLAVAIMRNCAHESLLVTAFEKKVNINLPMAPEVGLYLDECFFSLYNKKWKNSPGELSMKAYAEECKDFKMKYIYPHIASAEKKDGVVALWLHSLNCRNYPDLRGEDNAVQISDALEDEAEDFPCLSLKQRQTEDTDDIIDEFSDFGWTPSASDMETTNDATANNSITVAAFPDNFVDATDIFTTEQIFSNRDELLTWARDTGKANGFVVVITRSEGGAVGGRMFVKLGCERSGKYRKYKKELKGTSTRTKKCECPFKLKGMPLKDDEGWKLKVLCGYHNHERAETLEGHAYVGRLTKDEKCLLEDLTKNKVKPKNILLKLKCENKDNYTSISQIYTARRAYRRSQKGSKSEMQHLMMLLERDKYVYWHRRGEISDAVRDIFWTHRDAVRLLNAFPTVLLIDCIYKTNKCRLPLIEVVGITSTDMTFSVAFAYLSAERENNLMWALHLLRGLIQNDDALPSVIVIDRELMLKNVVQTIFPTSRILLCGFNIEKNVIARIKTHVHSKEEWELVKDAWDGLVWAPDEAEYKRRLEEFECCYAKFEDFVDYVKEIWLNDHKEKFVSAWIDRVMHLGCTTTNRVEGVHARLKMMFHNSAGDLCTCWDALHDLLTLQHNEIRASFQASTAVVDDRFNEEIYSKLRGFVSLSALTAIAIELERVKLIAIESGACGCIIRSTHGLPCACELSRYSTTATAIPLSAIHQHWKTLTFSELGMDLQSQKVSIEHELDAIWKQFDVMDVVGKINMKTKLHKLAFPDTAKYESLDWETVDAVSESNEESAQPSPPQIVAKEHKRKSVVPMLDQFPPQIQEYIESIVDVQTDGNCGFRAVASLLGRGEDSWPLIRMELRKEIQQWHAEYVELFGSQQRVNELLTSLLLDLGHPSGVVTPDKWMSMPDMGHVIASRYNIAMVFLSQNGCMTFFPLRRAPPQGHRFIALGLIDNCHFVQVHLKVGSPIPRTVLEWRKHAHANARSWEQHYINRMYHFTTLCPSTVEHIDTC